MEILGEIACLAAAVMWAFAVGLFRPSIEAHGARTINLLKSVVATVLLGITTLILGQGGHLLAAPRVDLGWVAASGLVGLTVGDTALFVAVARIGTHRSLLLQTLAPLFAAAVAVGWRGETLSGPEIVGGALVLAGVAVVTAPTRGQAAREGAARGRGWGTVLGIVSAAGQGVGVVLAKAGMSDLPFVPASFLRLAAASLGLVAVGLVTGTLFSAVRALSRPATLRQAVPASILGTYLAMLLMMAGVAYAPSSIAAVLLATPPVWSLFIEVRARREPLTARGVLGTVLAVAGVAVLTAL